MSNWLNDLLGVTSSSRQQYRYQQRLQTDAQNFNASEAEKERMWQTAMSNTEHQRAVADMQQAGINPILAAGAGADVSGGASASVSPGEAQTGTSGGNPLSMILNTIATAKNIDKINTDIKNQTDKTKADITNETDKTKAEVDKLNAETRNINQNTNNGGTGGTSFTRTVDWSAKKLKKANETKDEMLKNFQEKGKSLSWADFKQKLKSK